MDNSQLTLRCSSAPRWVPCPGSVSLEARHPDTEESLPAMEGTAAHWVASEVLTQWGSQGASVPIIDEYVGQTAPNGIVVTQEMVNAVNVYVKEVLATLQQNGGKLGDLMVEHSVSIDWIHPNNKGTLDCGAHLITHTGNILRVWDFKYGWGLVDPKTWQLINYGLGIVYGLPNDVLPTHIEFCIVQPRPYHRDGPIRKERITVQELYKLGEHVYNSAHNATSTSPRLSTGPHCDNCRGRHDCEALSNMTQRCREIIENTVPLDIPNNKIGRELELLTELEKLIKARKTGLESQITAKINNGNYIEGWTLEPGRGTRKWRGDNDTVREFGKLFNVDLSVDGVLTPAQAEKKGIDRKILNNFIKKIPGALKLTPQDNNHANKVFKNE